MAAFFSFSADSASAVLFALVLLLLLCKRRKAYTLPPGPRGLPIVGNLHNLKAPLYRTLQKLSQKYGPVMSLRLGSVPAIIISSSEMARQFYKSHDTAFASRPAMAFGKYICYNCCDLVFSPYGEYWRQVRKLCVMELLTVKSVESFKDVRRREVESMVRSIAEQSCGGTVDVDVCEALSVLTADVMWSAISGSDNEIVGKGNRIFKKFVEEIALAGAALNVGDFVPWIDWLDIQGVRRRYIKLGAAYDAFAEKLIRDRLTQNRDGKAEGDSKCFVDLLLAIFPNAESSAENRQKIKGLVFDMGAAGTDTTVTTMRWTMSLLLKHPESLHRLQQEIDQLVGRGVAVKEEDLPKLKYLQCVVKESMRLYPVIPLGLPHACTEDAEILGYKVPKGTTLYLNLWTIGRDPLVWGNDADEFRPERFYDQATLDLAGQGDMRSIPFSGGRRGCPGAVMALPLVQLAVATLVQRFDWSTSGEVDMEEGEGITVPRKRHLLARPKLRMVAVS